MLQIYNSATRALEPFEPMVPGKVTMYVCGPTVYNRIHLGNARSAVAFDVVRRYLEYLGYQVTHVSNLTDVDDKILASASEAGIPPMELTAHYEELLDQDLKELGVWRPNIRPRATEHISAIQNMISDLLAKGYAYLAEDGVYLSLQQVQGYGSLSGKLVGSLISGASGRLKEVKTNPHDFALWKFATGDLTWSSPWGHGRPGWHIECSAMIHQNLGTTVDIHGGGMDLEFPHHENERTQSELHTGEPLARYWMHNGFVNIDGHKLSKSGGRYQTLRDLLDQVEGQVLRLILVKQHYRKPLEFSPKLISEGKAILRYLREAYALPSEGQLDPNLDQIKKGFESAMDDDFNTANAVSEMLSLAKLMHTGHATHGAKDLLNIMARILGLELVQMSELSPEEADLLSARHTARESKDWDLADQLRIKLRELGIQVKDGRDGSTWERI